MKQAKKRESLENLIAYRVSRSITPSCLLPWESASSVCLDPVHGNQEELALVAYDVAIAGLV